MKFTGERFVPGEILDQEIVIEHLQRYEAVLEYVKDKVVVDAASGEGYGSQILAQLASKVYGVDISKEAVEAARKKYNKENLSFIEGSITKLPFDNESIDVIVSFETIEHIDKSMQIAFMKEIKRVLKKDGILIMSTPNKKIYSDEFNYHNEFHVKEFYKDEFITFIQNNFKYYKLYSQYKEIAYYLAEQMSDTLYKKGKYDEDYAKYYVCIAGDSILPQIEISEVYFENQTDYIYKMHRIIELQDEVEERNQHIYNLDKEMKVKGDQIIELQEEIEKRNQHIYNLDKEIKIKNERVMRLQEDVEERNQHLSYLDKSIEGKDEYIRGLQKELGEQEQMMKETLNEIQKMAQNNNRYIQKLEDELELADTLANELKDMLDVKQLINEELSGELTHLKELLKVNEEDRLKVELYEKELVELRANLIDYEEQQYSKDLLARELNEIKAELDTIYYSTGWRLLLKLYKIRDRSFPVNSKRRVIAKLAKKTLSNPSLYWKQLNFKNIKKLSNYMMNESGEKVIDRINDFDNKYGKTTKTALKTFKISDTYEMIEFEQVMQPKVSIIIPVYNQWEYTYNCLKSIKENTHGITYEVIIADDVSQDETRNISQYIKNINVVRNEKNLGFLLNCNNAAKQAKGEYIHFLNNDTQVQKEWLSSLVKLIESDEQIGMVGSKLVYPDGRLQEAGGILWQDGSAWNYGRYQDPDASEFNYVKEVDYISGASILITKALWDEIGGFDERYIPAYCEDSDLAFEVRRKGYKVMYQPLSVVVHFEGISNGTDTNVGLKAYQVTNQQKFYDKWKEVLQKEHFPNGEHAFWARDKSKNRKTLLMIDHYVPHYDKDAGSRTVFQYLKLFVQRGYNIKFIGDNFYRHEPYTTTLQQLGIEVLYGPHYAQNYEKWIKDNSEYINYVFCNRPHITEKYIDFLVNNLSAKIIYYGHDLHFLREMREYELIGDEKCLKASEEWKEKELTIMKKADVVYYPSQIEVDLIKEIDNSIVAKAIPAYIFNGDKQSKVYDISNRDGVMFIGGFGHKPNVDAVLWYVKEVLPHVLVGSPNIKAYILGSNPPSDIKELASQNVIIKGFVTDEELEAFYNQCRLSIVPLRYGAGIKGKVIEGMYHQIPILTTSVGAEGILNSENSLVVKDDAKEFAQALIELYDDNDRLKQLSSYSLEYVKKYYTMKRVEEVIGEDFDF